MRTKRGLFGEESFSPKRAIHLVGAYLMIAFSRFPCRIASLVLACNPCSAGSVKQVLCSKDVRFEEQLRILYRTVYMTLCGEVHHIVDVVLCKQSVSKFAVTNVTTHKGTAFVVYIILYSSEVTCVSQQVKNDNLYLLILILTIEKILDILLYFKLLYPHYIISLFYICI